MLLLQREPWRTTLLLAYQSLGVVYGDLSISPLYVYKSTFAEDITHSESNEEIFGVLSFVFWTLTLIPLIKYVSIVLRADDNGEGNLSQAAAVLFLLMRWHALTLGHALIAMAATAGLAAVLQAAQLRLLLQRPGAPLPVLALCWKIGGFSLGSNLLASAPVQILPWALAATGGTALTAAYQACGNLIQLSNPVVLGLCNIIPQTAARQRVAAGDRAAWHAARSYALLGAVPVFAYYGLLLAAPQPVLLGFYGAGSPYGAEGGLVRLMAVAALIAYGADMVCSYLHGIESARLAAGINMRGLAAALLLALPLALVFGSIGAGIGLIAVALARLVAAQAILPRSSAGNAYA